MIWKDINKTQPRVYQNVLWYCQGGAIKTGMYYGKDHCSHLPSCHPLHGRSRKYYGKFGRYAEPAGEGYVVTHWMTLPEPPQGKDE